MIEVVTSTIPGAIVDKRHIRCSKCGTYTQYNTSHEKNIFLKPPAKCINCNKVLHDVELLTKSTKARIFYHLN